MIVTYIRNDFEQSLHALTTGRRYDTLPGAGNGANSTAPTSPGYNP
jgi:hypothetical protein